MTTIETFLVISLIGNVLTVYLCMILITLYLHARRWRDIWHDAHVAMLGELHDVLRDEK